MKIKVLYFSSLKDKLRKSSEEIRLKDGFTVSNFINYLKGMYPETSENLDNIMVAVNEEYKDKSYVLKDGDIVALIPPVSGG